ncbi:hypothetical protein F5Y15DRAFT_374388 [Xylariaceae sp. FL0016]|nr:hypothetical protein F5Y15DRAFT_374388 [Xylariaceae sp. FL0016]
MRFSSIACLVASAGSAVALPSADQNVRSVSDAMAYLKRDPSGEGFAHLGSDNVVRSFDKRFNVIDFAQLDTRGPSGSWPRDPGDAVLGEAKRARARSEGQVSRPRSRDVISMGRESCVSEFCPDDSYCQGLTIYGYNCTSCLMVSDDVGNCQTY